jgi:hypothetical protein
MRAFIVTLPLLIAASPVAAQAPAPSKLDDAERVLSDPGMADRLSRAMDAVSDALLNLPVGKVQAAVEGRQPTAAEKHMTVRDLERRHDPNFERNFHRQMAEMRPRIEQSMKAMADALPTVMKGLSDASEAIDRAAANIPDPTYPKR